MQKIFESGEMYLEDILVLKKRGDVRSIDVANFAGYSRPSVSRAINLLKRDGYITVDAHGYIDLTKNGRALAEKIYERHNVMTDFFQMIGVSSDAAEQDACRIEHVISDETFDKIKEHASSLKSKL